MGIGCLFLPFLKSIENLLDLLPSSKLRRKEFDLPFAIHLPTQTSILEKVTSLCLELEDETQLMNPAFRFDRIQEDGMENRDVLFPRFDSGMKGDVSQGIHDLGDIDVIGTPDAAGVTRGADPDRF